MPFTVLSISAAFIRERIAPAKSSKTLLPTCRASSGLTLNSESARVKISGLGFETLSSSA